MDHNLRVDHDCDLLIQWGLLGCGPHSAWLHSNRVVLCSICVHCLLWRCLLPERLISNLFDMDHLCPVLSLAELAMITICLNLPLRQSSRSMRRSSMLWWKMVVCWKVWRRCRDWNKTMNLNENIEVQRGTSYPHDDLSWIVDQLKLLLVVFLWFWHVAFLSVRCDDGGGWLVAKTEGLTSTS